MTISTSSTIIATDLNTVWTSVNLVNAIKSTSRYEVDVATFNFDSVDTSLANKRIWVPPVDCQIVGISVMAATTSTLPGTATFTITANTNSTLAPLGVVITGSSVRTDGVVPDGVFTVLAGDNVIITPTNIPGASSLGPPLLRLHICYKTKWSRT